MARRNLFEVMRSGGPNPWASVTLDQVLYQLSQFGYQGLGYGPGMIQTLQQNRETIAADFLGFINGAFKTNGAIFACMLTRMMLFSEARFQWQRMTNGRPGQLFGTKDLALLETPWPNATTGDLLVRAISDIDLAGNFYCTRTPLLQGRGSKLGRLRPDWVTIIKGTYDDPGLAGSWDPTAELIGYLYTPGGPGSGLKPKTYLPHEISHCAPLVDPAASYRGMSWVQPVLEEVLGDKSMTTHKVGYFNNGASGNLVVSMETGRMDRRTFKEWIDTFENEHAGAINSFKCLHPDTEVLLWNGARCPAREIRVGDTVVAWSDDGPVPGLVSACAVQPPSTIVTVTTERGRVIRTTENHPFLVHSAGFRDRDHPADRWVDACQLEAGDRLVTGLGWGRPRLQDSLTTDEAWLLGLLVGDGCLVPSTAHVSVANLATLEHLGGIASIVKTGNPRGPYDYRVRGIAEMVRAAGLNGKRSWEKRIPAAVMSGGVEVTSAFISGYLDADGSVSDPAIWQMATVSFSSASIELLRDLQHLLASLGLNASLSSPPSLAVGVSRHAKHDGHRLACFGNAQAATLHGLLNLSNNVKRDRLGIYAERSSQRDRSRYDRVASIAFGAPEPTIAVEVAGHHTHVTGGVVTHNTIYLGHGASVTQVGSHLKDLDYRAVQGQTELRICAAAGVHPIVVGFYDGIQSATMNNFHQAVRLTADKCLRPLWRNFVGSMQTLVPPPPGARLWYDDRDIPFLQDDEMDEASVLLTKSTAARLLADAGFDPDTVVDAIESNDFAKLKGGHSGLFSVQLQPPGTAKGGSNGLPSGIGNGKGNGSGVTNGGTGLASADNVFTLLDNVGDVQQLAKALLAAKAGD